MCLRYCVTQMTKALQVWWLPHLEVIPSYGFPDEFGQPYLIFKRELFHKYWSNESKITWFFYKYVWVTFMIMSLRLKLSIDLHSKSRSRGVWGDSNHPKINQQNSRTKIKFLNSNKIHKRSIGWHCSRGACCRRKIRTNKKYAPVYMFAEG